jgi:hypothetical protein
MQSTGDVAPVASDDYVLCGWASAQCRNRVIGSAAVSLLLLARSGSARNQRDGEVLWRNEVVMTDEHAPNRTRCLRSMLLAIGVAVALGITSAADAGSGRHLTGPERVLLRLAIQCHDPHPTSISVLGRRGPYEAVIAIGRFVCRFSRIGGGLPRGELLWAIVDSRTDAIGFALGLAPSIRGGRTAARAALAGGP